MLQEFAEANGLKTPSSLRSHQAYVDLHQAPEYDLDLLWPKPMPFPLVLLKR